MRISDWSSDVCSSDLQLDFFVSIDKRQAKPRSEPPSHSRFANTHHAHQNNGAVDSGVEGFQVSLHGRRGYTAPGPYGKLSFYLVAPPSETGNQPIFGGDRKSTRLNSSH